MKYHPGVWSRKQMGQVAAKNAELMSTLGLGDFACLWEAAVPREKGAKILSVSKWSKCHMASLPRDSLSSFFSKTGIIHPLRGVRIK